MEGSRGRKSHLQKASDVFCVLCVRIVRQHTALYALLNVRCRVQGFFENDRQRHDLNFLRSKVQSANYGT
jgi:hypothetical protein